MTYTWQYKFHVSSYNVVCPTHRQQRNYKDSAQDALLAMCVLEMERVFDV